MSLMRRRAPLLPGEFLNLLRRAVSRGAIHTSPSVLEWDISGGCERPLEIVEPPPAGLRAAILVRKVRCGKCERCLKRRQREWTGRAFRETERSARTWFVTLTLPTDVHMWWWKQAMQRAEQRAVDWDSLEVEERVRFLDKVIEPELQKYLKRVRENSRGKLRFLQVTEPHMGGGQNHGLPHWHLLVHEDVSRGTTKRVLCEAWSEGFASAKLADREAVLYVAKYASKRMSGRVRASQRYGRPAEDPRGPQTPSGSGTGEAYKESAPRAVEAHEQGTPPSPPTAPAPDDRPPTGTLSLGRGRIGDSRVVGTVQKEERPMGYPVAYRKGTGQNLPQGSQTPASRPYSPPANDNVPRPYKPPAPANDNFRAQPPSSGQLARGAARLVLHLGRGHPLFRWLGRSMDAWQLGRWLRPEQEAMLMTEKPLGFGRRAICATPSGPTNVTRAVGTGDPGALLANFVNTCLDGQGDQSATLTSAHTWALYAHRYFNPGLGVWRQQMTELIARPATGPLQYHYILPWIEEWPWWDPMALPILQPVPAPRPRPAWSPRPRPRPEPAVSPRVAPVIAPASWPGPVPFRQVMAGRPVDVSITFTPGRRPNVRVGPARNPAPPEEPGVKERKFSGPGGATRGAYVAAVGAYDTVTEVGDFIDALFDALPKDIRDQYPGKTTMFQKAGAIADNFDALDVNEALQNVAENAIQDAVLGRSQGMAGEALGHNPGASRGITGGWSSVMAAGA